MAILYRVGKKNLKEELCVLWPFYSFILTLFSFLFSQRFQSPNMTLVVVTLILLMFGNSAQKENFQFSYLKLFEDLENLLS